MMIALADSNAIPAAEPNVILPAGSATPARGTPVRARAANKPAAHKSARPD